MLPNLLVSHTLWWQLTATFVLFHRNMATWERRRDVNDFEVWGRKVMKLRILFGSVLITKTNPGCSKDNFPFLLSFPSFKTPSPHYTPLDTFLPTVPSLFHDCLELLNEKRSCHIVYLLLGWFWLQYDTFWPLMQIRSHISISSCFRFLYYSLQHVFPLYRLKPEKSEPWVL